MSAVDLTGVHKAFPGRRGEQVEVLRGIDVAVEQGEFLAILGASGCGKSTLLRLISGLEIASGGIIAIDGEEVTGTPPEQRSLAMVFQNYALFPHLSVRENVLFGLKSRGESRAVQRERLAETAGLLGLEELLNRRPAELSGGQRQRVALARALVSGQQLILMDEPLSNLDAKLRAEMRVELKRIQRQLGLTIIYVTHDQVEAMTMADRVMMLSQGRIEQIATPEELYRAPATTTVARFIGSPPMNVLEVDAHRASVLGAPAAIARDGGSVGIRAEHLRVLRTKDPQNGGISLGEGTVEVNELLGADRILTVSLDGQRVLVRADPERDVAVDSPVELTARLEHLHWYDRQTSARITPEGTR
ncbi:ABC transporter ATP-binding protein [Nesterenkonia lacusekhoensis]|uniref:Sn-glycerol 3-phosphate transport system ATP-binding protein n=1 Tax=Nesterenkonia lacusekhoensis TaxID=150832 RepID=A0ABS4SZ07_9MICC|nr:sn-glycerol 3-phosphate transport system ATP-binding protein [Nesterenkonia lacusekhoensis]